MFLLRSTWIVFVVLQSVVGNAVDVDGKVISRISRGVGLNNDTQQPQPCKTLVVAGAVYRSNINAHYELDSSFGQRCSSRPVWRNVPPRTAVPAGASGGAVNGAGTGNDTFIYYREDGYDGWLIASTSCFTWGNFMAGVQSDAQMPYDVTETWQESKAGYGFVVSQSLTVRCVTEGVGLNLNTDALQQQPFWSSLAPSIDNPRHVTYWTYTRNAKVWIIILTVVGIMTCISLLATILGLWHQQKQRSFMVQSRKEPGDHSCDWDSNLRYKRLEKAASQTSIIMA